MRETIEKNVLWEGVWNVEKNCFYVLNETFDGCG